MIMHRSIAIILLDLVVQTNADVAPQASAQLTPQASATNRTGEEFIDKFDSMLNKLFDEKTMFPNLDQKEGPTGDDKDSKELVDKIMGKLFSGLGEKSDQAAQGAKGSADKLDGKEFMDKFINQLFTKDLKVDPPSADAKQGGDASTKELVDSMMKLFEKKPGDKASNDAAGGQKGTDDSKQMVDNLMNLFNPKPGDKAGLPAFDDKGGKEMVDNWINKLFDTKGDGKADPLSKLFDTKGDGKADPLSKLFDTKDGKADPLSKLFGDMKGDGKDDPLSKLFGDNADLSKLLGGKADLNNLFDVGEKTDIDKSINKLFDTGSAKNDPLSGLPSLRDRYAPRARADGVSRRRAPGQRRDASEEVQEEEEAAYSPSSLRGQVESFADSFPVLAIPMPVAIMIGLLAGSGLTLIMSRLQKDKSLKHL
eukprot:gnl/MRDRNA2_/MRDRNA2_27986_c0_seq1.p1 gnl/MRDRNA2_/MRDRNA2_27986_c0~~gnl/MRDRNA2_/MRDRNA2_27986_c0_seq1.p1  ORF type:complete len:423 (-),score=117.84 gnl/MRDRNA2_/MRDRNA2_27986_c0_seq1:82-1350(-)